MAGTVRHHRSPPETMTNIDPSRLAVGQQIRRQPCGRSCVVAQISSDRSKVLVRDLGAGAFWVHMITLVKKWRR